MPPATRTVYEGIPADYKPAVTPLIPWGSTAMPANAPAGTNVSTYWDTNTVWMPLKDGTTVRTSDFTGVLNPFMNQWSPGVLQWGQDASLFKVISIKESVRLRINADVFNVFNHPGQPQQRWGGRDGDHTQFRKLAADAAIEPAPDLLSAPWDNHFANRVSHFARFRARSRWKGN